jgi:hypothetical protein
VDICTALTGAPGITASDPSVVLPEMAAVFRWSKSVSEEHRKKQNTVTVPSLKRTPRLLSSPLYCASQEMSSKNYQQKMGRVSGLVCCC